MLCFQHQIINAVLIISFDQSICWFAPTIFSSNLLFQHPEHQRRIQNVVYVITAHILASTIILLNQLELFAFGLFACRH